MIFFYPKYKKITQKTIRNMINKIDVVEEVVASNQDMYFLLLYNTYFAHLPEASLKNKEGKDFKLTITLYENNGFSIILIVSHSVAYYWDVEICFHFTHTLNNFNLPTPSFSYNKYLSTNKSNISNIKSCFVQAKQYLKDMFKNAEKLLNTLEDKKTDLVLTDNEFTTQGINNLLILLPFLSKKWRHFTCSHEEEMVSDYYQEVPFFGLTYDYTRITMLLEKWKVPLELYSAIEALSIPWWFGVATIHPTCPENYIFFGPMLKENFLRFQVDNIFNHTSYAIKFDIAEDKITANEFANYYHKIYKDTTSNLKIESKFLTKINKTFGSRNNKIKSIGGTFEKYIPLHDRALLENKHITEKAVYVASKIRDLIVLPPLTNEEKAEEEALNNLKLVDIINE